MIHLVYVVRYDSPDALPLRSDVRRDAHALASELAALDGAPVLVELRPKECWEDISIPPVRLVERKTR